MKYFCVAAGLLALLALCGTATAQCTDCGEVSSTTGVQPTAVGGGDTECNVSCGRCGLRSCKKFGCRLCGGGSNCPQPWHGAYYGPYTGSCGAPLALVVPPTAQFQTRWSWGVGGMQVVPINTQFQRSGYYPPAQGEIGGAQGFYPTPRWPSSTDQFGVYYSRAPW